MKKHIYNGSYLQLIIFTMNYIDNLKHIIIKHIIMKHIYNETYLQ